MGANTAIQWAHHTFNPWRGCTKVSAGCANCYAETQSRRNPKVLGEWGNDGVRVVGVEKYWGLPRTWDRKAKSAGERHRVFCASLADVFEDRPELVQWRARLFDLIRETPNLDWLLLTKRPQNVMQMISDARVEFWDDTSTFRMLSDWRFNSTPPANVWIGTSVEDQATSDERILHLLKIPAVVRFLSVEPLLGAVDLRLTSPCYECEGKGYCDLGPMGQEPCGRCGGEKKIRTDDGGIHLVIVGGESGPNARPMHPDWVRSLRDQCQQAGVAFFLKQWGEWAVGADRKDWIGVANDSKLPLGDPDLNVVQMSRIGKKSAGRMLDGREWNEFPEVRQC